METPRHIFGKAVLSPGDLWNLYSGIVERPEIWTPDSFATSATYCGFKRVARRKSNYFSFYGPTNSSGQAPITAGLVEEIRITTSKSDRDTTAELWEADQPKLALLGSAYSSIFREHLGSPRRANNNDIFESDGYRVRILASQFVWVVVQSLSIIDKLPNDWWAPRVPT